MEEITVRYLNIKKGYTPMSSSSMFKTAILPTKGLLYLFLRVICRNNSPSTSKVTPRLYY